MGGLKQNILVKTEDKWYDNDGMVMIMACKISLATPSFCFNVNNENWEEY